MPSNVSPPGSGSPAGFTSPSRSLHVFASRPTARCTSARGVPGPSAGCVGGACSDGGCLGGSSCCLGTSSGRPWRSGHGCCVPGRGLEERRGPELGEGEPSWGEASRREATVLRRRCSLGFRRPLRQFQAVQRESCRRCASFLIDFHGSKWALHPISIPTL